MSTSESATTAKSKPFIPSEKKPATPRPSSFSSVSARKIQVKALLTSSSAARRASDIPAPSGGGTHQLRLATTGPRVHPPSTLLPCTHLLWSWPAGQCWRR